MATILIVEDDAIIGLELEDVIAHLGHAVLGPAVSIDHARAAIAGGKPDIALLDANLGGVSTFAFGEELAAQGVRVVFCTGYVQLNLPPSLQNVLVLTKPIGEPELAAALAKLIS
jgi:DNA-binding LytR/AlgR family response regulator